MNVQRGSMQVLLEGRGKVVLRQNDYVATGGEGSIYRAKGTVVKVYTDQMKMRRDRMDQKIELLKSYNHPYIVAPTGLVTSQTGGPVGFYMPFVDGEPLARVFTNAYWKREGFAAKDASQLVARMREAVTYAHSKQALMVDANELNWLVVRDAGGYEPRVIDVDSWAVGAWPATVIMPSIRDPHASAFSPETDWYAWAVVTFQVYSGIHPYKGKLAGFAPHDLIARMAANASVFRDEVRLNGAVRDFRTIPALLLDWYESVFERGERTVPPSPFDTGQARVRAARTLRMVTTAQGAVVYRKLFARAGDPVVRVYPSGIVLLASGDLVDLASKRTVASRVGRDGEVVQGRPYPVRAYMRQGAVEVEELRAGVRSLAKGAQVHADRVVRSGERLFALGDRGLEEISVRTLGKASVIALGTVWQVMPHATRWFDGLGVMDALGAMHLVVPSGDKAVAIVRVPELDDRKVIQALSCGRIAVLVAMTQKGEYVRMDVLFDHAMQQYVCSQRVVDAGDLNAVVLPKGVVASIEEEGELVVTVPTTGVVNKVADKDMTTDMLLARWGDKVVYIKDGAVWSLAMQ